MAGCTGLFDVLRARTEDLGPTLHSRASWKDIWLNIVPRDNYPKGAGYVRSSFQIARSEPGSEEETWNAINPINSETNASGACNLTYNQTYVGEHEDQYKPENFGLMGPLVCQDDFTMYWRSAEFWDMYFKRLEQRNRKSVINRLGNIYRTYSYKAAASNSFSYVVGKWQAAQPAPSIVDMTDYTTGALGLPTSELTQEMLDVTATELMEEGADEGDTDAWISQGADGPQWPLYIGTWMSHRLFLNNSELRSDLNQSFQGWGDLNPVIKRLGASRILKNFRHVINRFPARWIFVPNGTTINYTSTGLKSNTGVTVTYNNTIGVIPGTGNPANTPTPDGTDILIRIPSFVNSTAAFDVTKGQAGIVNGVWRDPNVTVTGGSSAGVASFESVEVLNPLVMTEEVLMPVNSMPGMTLTPQNYFGEWKFVTGNDALLGIGGCTGITDPLHKQGRHFAEYRHALKPVFPIFGRMILFRRCPDSFDTVTCS
jgi:hypothetical protein